MRTEVFANIDITDRKDVKMKKGIVVLICVFGITASMSASADDAVILHRVVLTCDGVPLSGEQIIDLSSSSTYYTCESRFQEHCIDDGTWDAFYMEWCDYEDPTCDVIAPQVHLCDSGAEPTAAPAVPGASCRAKKLHRIVRDCDGTQLSPEQVINWPSSNYTCGNRFMEHCVNDGTFDSYYEEWCEYECELDKWAQCGGQSGECYDLNPSTCVDAPWPGYACESGTTCVRQSQWYWQCL